MAIHSTLEAFGKKAEPELVYNAERNHGMDALRDVHGAWITIVQPADLECDAVHHQLREWYPSHKTLPKTASDVGAFFQDRFGMPPEADRSMPAEHKRLCIALQIVSVAETVRTLLELTQADLTRSVVTPHNASAETISYPRRETHPDMNAVRGIALRREPAVLEKIGKGARESAEEREARQHNLFMSLRQDLFSIRVQDNRWMGHWHVKGVGSWRTIDADREPTEKPAALSVNGRPVPVQLSGTQLLRIEHVSFEEYLPACLQTYTQRMLHVLQKKIPYVDVGRGLKS